MITITVTEAVANQLIAAYDRATYQGIRDSLGLEGIEALNDLCARLEAQLAAQRAGADTQPIVTMRIMEPAPKDQGYPYERSPNETVCGPTDQRCPDCGKQLEWPSDAQGTYCAECISRRLGDF